MRLPRDRKTQLRWGLIVAALGLAYFVYQQFFPEIDPEQVLRAVADTLGDWTYLLVGVLAFAETGAFIGLVFPGETAVIVAGAVAGQGVTNVVITLGIVWFCAWGGDSVSFLLGQKLGREFILEHGPRVRITHERFHRVESYFQRHGGKTILVGRFVGLVRALAPFIAGSSGMSYRGFVPYSVLGTGLWAATFTLLGYFFSRNIDEASALAGRGAVAFGLVVAIVVGGYALARFMRQAENRERLVRSMERRPGLRALVALGRRLRAPLGFLADRLTPGVLGLELTSLLAVIAVAGFVFVGYASMFSASTGPTPGDALAADVAERLRADWLTGVAEAVTALGSGWLFTPAAVAAGVLFGLRRWWPELAVLALGAALISIGVPELKEAIARPRPPGGLIDVRGFAYPSGHATHSTLFAFVAVVLAYRLPTGRLSGSALVLIGLALAVAVGLTRVYLNVHYFSDVAGGWAFGSLIFATLGSIALIVTHFRHNPAGMRDRQASNGARGEQPELESVRR